MNDTELKYWYRLMLVFLFVKICIFHNCLRIYYVIIGLWINVFRFWSLSNKNKINKTKNVIFNRVHIWFLSSPLFVIYSPKTTLFLDSTKAPFYTFEGLESKLFHIENTSITNYFIIPSEPNQCKLVCFVVVDISGRAP